MNLRVAAMKQEESDTVNEKHAAHRSVKYAIALDDGAELLFYAGEPRDPCSVGRSGAFRVEGNGVLDVHAFLHFDGQRLFICSTDSVSPVLLDGAPLPRRWTELSSSCRLRFGAKGASFELRETSPPRGSVEPLRGKSAAASVEPSRGKSAAASVEPSSLEDATVIDIDASRRARRSAAEKDAESLTRAFSLEATQFAPHTPAAPPSSVLKVQGDTGATRIYTLPTPAPAAAPAPVSPRASRVPPSMEATQASIAPRDARQKLIMAGCIFLIVTLIGTAGVIFVRIGLQRHRPRPAPPAASSVPMAAPSPAAVPAPLPTGIVLHAAPPTEAVVPAPPGSAAAAPTPERAAVDAFHTGDFPRALQLYEQLAKEHPDNPAFENAVNALRQRTSTPRPTRK